MEVKNTPEPACRNQPEVRVAVVVQRPGDDGVLAAVVLLPQAFGQRIQQAVDEAV
jgi:hypothetical protein